MGVFFYCFYGKNIIFSRIKNLNISEQTTTYTITIIMNKSVSNFIRRLTLGITETDEFHLEIRLINVSII